MRGFLRQACKASEAKMKRAAAMELIAGEWYVMAMYNGKPCKFQMVPVDEILELRTALVEHVPAKVLAQTEYLVFIGRQLLKKTISKKRLWQQMKESNRLMRRIIKKH